ncbi:hypothetical protein [Saccharopolyspora taberi]|uniref:Uncharacterized protein n=1 Tax=Saccharopolyspora taberi TaxID=60895 RepID=A0ABN3VCF0_9PSEU
MRDALSGRDGTQPLPASTVYPDVLSGLTTAYPPLRPAEPVPPAELSEEARRAVRSKRRSRSTEPEWSVPAAYGNAEQASVAPAQNLPAQRRNIGGRIVGVLIMLVIFGSLAIGIVRALLEEFGVLGP